MVGDLDHVEVVFDDDHRIAAVDEFVEHIEQQADVLEMKPRRRFVEDVERTPRIALGQLGGELDTLALAARERGAGLSEREVAEADLLDGTEFLVDGRIFSKNSTAMLTVMFSTSSIFLPLYFTSSVSRL